MGRESAIREGDIMLVLGGLDQFDGAAKPARPDDATWIAPQAHGDAPGDGPARPAGSGEPSPGRAAGLVTLTSAAVYAEVRRRLAQRGFCWD
jgi:hypothetical protein